VVEEGGLGRCSVGFSGEMRFWGVGGEKKGRHTSTEDINRKKKRDSRAAFKNGIVKKTRKP